MPIKPRVAAGIRDYLPQDMIPRQKMFETIRTVFESFGFVPLDTPGLELEEILTGGDPDFDKQIFRVRERESESETLALRFDLTVPLARVFAEHSNEIERPFKRYQVGKVWRGEKPQAGRFREFVQFDADTVGTSRTSADAEIIALMFATMKELGFEKFEIRVNNRKVLNGLSEYIGFDSKLIPDVLRLIDKLDRFGWDNVAGELTDRAGFSPTQLESLKKFLDFRANDQEKVIAGVRELMKNSSTAMEGIDELAQIGLHLNALGIPSDKWVIDLSVARGLGYYTGPVFETILTDLPKIGSVFSGGRYDGLVERFGTVVVPATGASIGVDRLFAAMEQLGLVKQEKTIAKVLVLNFDPVCELLCEATVSLIRASGIPAEIYLGKESLLKGQLSYAVRQEFSVVVIIGQNEKDEGIVSVKDMKSRTQHKVELAVALRLIEEILAHSERL